MSDVCKRGHVYPAAPKMAKRVWWSKRLGAEMVKTYRRCLECERGGWRRWREKNGYHVGPHNRDKTTCKQGHPLSGENLFIRRRRYVRKSGEARDCTMRQCRICHRASVEKSNYGPL